MSSGESSSSGRENGAASLDSDRPHKKARFPWQIKGKHHLKNQTNELTETPTTDPTEQEPVTPSPNPIIQPSNRVVPFYNSLSSESVGTSLADELEANGSKNYPTLLSQITPDYLPSLPLETVISLAENMLLQSEIEGNKIVTDDLFKTKSKKDLRDGPCNHVISEKEARRIRRLEDRYISRWQMAQNMRGCFDNTINRVLESWMNTHVPIPIPAGEEEAFMAINFPGITHPFPSRDVENEAILMAINAHGLQNVTGGPSLALMPGMPHIEGLSAVAWVPKVAGAPTVAISDKFADTLDNEIPFVTDYDSSICSDDFETERESFSPWPSDDRASSQPSPDIPESRIAMQPEPGQYFNKTHLLPGNDFNRGEEYEFMNNAVIQAIKSKGLVAAGTDFG